MYLVPPMDDEPPRDFVDFVAVHLADAQREAARLVGGPQHADEVYPAALSDVAGHWRRLRLRRWARRRLTHGPGDVAAEALHRRLATRAKQWRDDQVYDVEVRLLRPPTTHAAATASIALRKAALLPGTARRQARPLAEASIAWSHAWNQARWRRIARTVAAFVIVLVALIQALPALPD
jgi:hypothetical protein